jgi:hypothetical protein
MVWESALKDIAICLFPVLAPVPFGAKIIETHSSNKEFIENMATISPIHEAWAKLISDTIKQHETNDENKKIFNKILQAKDTQSSTIRAATKGIRTTFFVRNSPFLKVSHAATIKFKQELDSLHSFFVCNPTPVACVKPNDSDDDVEMVQVPVQGASTQHQPIQPVQQQPVQSVQQQPFQQPATQQQPNQQPTTQQQPFQQQPFFQPTV